MCIGGIGLTSGYWNKTELNHTKFIKHPFDNQKVLYKTGDLAKWLPNGELDYLGRSDEQIKLRGFHIEIQEIENTILQFLPNNSFKIIVYQNNLVCFHLGKINKENIIPKLKSVLPDYMIPTQWIELDFIPLTTNGKVDKNQLITFILKENQYCVDIPKTWVEEKLVKIWSEILLIKESQVSVQKDFYELGGNSLNLIKMAHKIYQELGIKLSYRQILEAQSIEGIRKLITNQNQSNEYCFYILNEFYENLPTLILIPPTNGEGLIYKSFAQFFNKQMNVYTLDLERPWEIQQNIDVQMLASKLANEIQQRFAQNTLFIGGYSFGIRLVYYISLNLHNLVNQLINFDGIIYKSPEEEKFLLNQFIEKEKALGKDLIIDEDAYRFVNDYFSESIQTPILHFKGDQSIVQFFDIQFLTTENVKIQYLRGEHENLFDDTENLKVMSKEILKLL